MLRALAVALVLCLPACGPSPADRPRAAGSIEPQRPAIVAAPAVVAPPDPQAFASRVAGIDAFELQAAQAAMARSADAQVRQFAVMMIRDHEVSSLALRKAVSEATRPLNAVGAPPPGLQAQLSRAVSPDAAFDLAYIESQVAAHEQALRLLRTYAETGDEPALVAFASGAAGTVRGHYDHARRLEEQLRRR